jgi:hypothetical protein
MTTVSILSNSKATQKTGKDNFSEINKQWLERREYDSGIDEEILNDEKITSVIIQSKDSKNLEYTIDEKHIKEMLQTEQLPIFPIAIPLDSIMSILEEMWDEEESVCKVCTLL